jgi:Integrase core domain
VVGVEQWAELRRLHFVGGVSIRELQRRTGLHRATIRRALRGSEPPRYRRRAGVSKLVPFKAEIQRLLREDPRLPTMRVFELLAELASTGARRWSMTMWPSCGRSMARGRGRFSARSIAAASCCSSICGSPAGRWRSAMGRRGAGGWWSPRWASRALGPPRWSSHGRRPTSWPVCGAACVRLGALPETLVIDREGALHAGGGRPSDVFAAFCGQLRVGWRFCEPADPQAKGVVERLQGYLETNFEPARNFVNQHDFQDQLDRWFDRRANRRLHRTLRRRPVDLLAEERQAMRPLPERAPDTERRWVLRVPPDPHVRVDTNDYSLDPRLVGRRVEIRVDQRQVTGIALDTGELACRHQRLFARHRTITALEHARALKAARRGGRAEPEVETRPLARYDRLIPA